MTAQESTTEKTSSQKVFIKMAISAWDTYNARVDALINKITDEQLKGETAPGRNSGIYLLGHLIAVSDGLFPILGFGKRLYPELDKIFLDTPDHSGQDMPSINKLKSYWINVNEKLSEHISRVPDNEWFSRHNNVSAADFANEPHRNKLNIIINRTSHTSYHLGQMAYLEIK
ncbi:MAG: DinB family protein [Chitinophagaceae bacterium]